MFHLGLARKLHSLGHLTLKTYVTGTPKADVYVKIKRAQFSNSMLHKWYRLETMRWVDLTHDLNHVWQCPLAWRRNQSSKICQLLEDALLLIANINTTFMQALKAIHRASQIANTTLLYHLQIPSRYEPYILVDRTQAPWHDARFRGYGSDKVSYISSVYHAKFHFMVYPNAWVLHRPHPKSRARCGVRSEHAFWAGLDPAWSQHVLYRSPEWYKKQKTIRAHRDTKQLTKVKVVKGHFHNLYFYNHRKGQLKLALEISRQHFHNFVCLKSVGAQRSLFV